MTIDLEAISVDLNAALRSLTALQKLENRGSPVLAAEHVAHLKELHDALLNSHVHVGSALQHVNQLLTNAGAVPANVKVLSAEPLARQLRHVRTLRKEL